MSIGLCRLLFLIDEEGRTVVMEEREGLGGGRARHVFLCCS